VERGSPFLFDYLKVIKKTVAPSKKIISFFGRRYLRRGKKWRGARGL
jgi:hypothetical protein